MSGSSGTGEELRRATLFAIACHGYAIASWLRDATDERLQVEADWGRSENNRKAKFYQLTHTGRKQLRAKTAVWTEYAAAVFDVLRAD